MSKKYRQIRNSSIEFDEQSFKLIMTQKSLISIESLRLDFSVLRGYFSDRFLLNIADYLVFRSEKGLAFSTIRSEGSLILSLLKKTIGSGLIKENAQIELMTQTLLDCLCLIDNKLLESELRNLSLIFNTKFLGIFGNDVTKSSLPRKTNPLGHLGSRIKNILKQSFSPATLASIMVILENHYEEGEITLGQWAYFNLMLNTRVRIGSIRMMSVADIVHDEKKDEYYAYILPEKQNVDNPQKSTFLLTRSVGRILRKQRLEVLKCNNSRNIAINNQNKIALFPSIAFQNVLLRKKNELGFYESLEGFRRCYQTPINNLLAENKISTNIFRHSVGTHLASNGMSSKTIQAVLRHVGARTCQAYVELHLNGNLERLSDALEPAFDKYFPVFKEFLFSKELYDQSKLIFSDNLESGESVKEGLCGSDMRCFSAPFSCYSCKKFTPFYDVDHEINLKIIESKITKFKLQGLAFQDSIQTLKNTKAFINLTIQACNSYKRSLNDY